MITAHLWPGVAWQPLLLPDLVLGVVCSELHEGVGAPALSVHHVTHRHGQQPVTVTVHMSVSNKLKCVQWKLS